MLQVKYVLLGEQAVNRLQPVMRHLGKCVVAAKNALFITLMRTLTCMW
jgi:hypothetical protein